MVRDQVRNVVGAAACAVALAAVSTAAQAAPISFTFPTTASQDLGNSTVFGSTPSGFTVTATAYSTIFRLSYFEPWSTTTQGQPVQISNVDLVNGDGLGVTKPGVANNTGGQAHIDSRGLRIEGILFDFGALKLDSATLRFGGINFWDSIIVSWGDAPPDFSVPVSGQPTLFPNTSGPVQIWSVGKFTGNGFDEVTNLYSNLNGARYLFVQAAHDTGADDSHDCSRNGVNCFRLNGIEIMAQASAIPEPEGLGLLGLAAAGMGLVSLGRKRL